MELKSDMRSLISVAYYSRRLAQVVYTILVHIDSTKEIIEDSFVIVHTTMKLQDPTSPFMIKLVMG